MIVIKSFAYYRCRYHISVAIATALVLIPAITQVVAEQVIEAIGKVSVSFIFHACFRVCGLLLTLCAILVSELVDEILSEFTTLNVYLNLPAILAIENLIDKLASNNLWGLLAK